MASLPHVRAVSTSRKERKGLLANRLTSARSSSFCPLSPLHNSRHHGRSDDLVRSRSMCLNRVRRRAVVVAGNGNPILASPLPNCRCMQVPLAGWLDVRVSTRGRPSCRTDGRTAVAVVDRGRLGAADTRHCTHTTRRPSRVVLLPSLPSFLSRLPACVSPPAVVKRRYPICHRPLFSFHCSCPP